MLRRNPADSRSAASGRRKIGIAAGAAAVMLAAAAATVFATGVLGSRHGNASSAHLAASACSGPAGAAYVADAGWDGFSAIDTATCAIVQTYNVGDTQVPGDPGDYNYSSTNEAVAIHGNKLYFANTGNSTVAVINTAKLNPSNYNPAEKLIHVGLFPEDLAVTPSGRQVWVADTGPQTSPSSPSDISVISAAKKKVIATLPLRGSPSQITFSPSGTRAYVATSQGLVVFSTATRQVVGFIRGLGDPRGVAVSPDGSTVYVTDTDQNTVSVINAATDQVTATIQVGEMPWQVVVSASGQTVYVADPDSDAVSVINTTSNTVSSTISLTGDPDTLALTPNGAELWVGQSTAAFITVLDTATNAVLTTINLGGTVAQSADGYEPTGIALTTTPTPGDSAASVGGSNASVLGGTRR
jgi:YVTN family beta-propeller protein